MKTKMAIRILFLLAGGLLAVLGGCNLFDGAPGSVTVSMTDAPVDAANVAGVWITVSGIQYNASAGSDDNWGTFTDFAGPKKINLLAATDGLAETLGTLSLAAGQYNQIRFTLDAAEDGTTVSGTPGCYLEFTDGTTAPLWVPSADKTGFKAVNAFTVPSNGTVSITADFDVRRAVRKTTRQGADTYILRPTLRLVVDGQAGKIRGAVSHMATGAKVAVFAYAAGTYTAAEAAAPASTDTAQFPNSVTSALVKLDAASGEYRYVLAYLAAGSYDLVVGTLDTATNLYAVNGVVAGVAVTAQAVTSQALDMATLSLP